MLRQQQYQSMMLSLTGVTGGSHLIPGVAPARTSDEMQLGKMRQPRAGLRTSLDTSLPPCSAGDHGEAGTESGQDREISKGKEQGFKER